MTTSSTLKPEPIEREAQESERQKEAKIVGD